MLVRAFEIDIRLPGGFINNAAIPKRESMRGAGIEPDVQNVRNLLPLIRIDASAQKVRLLRGEPGIDAAIADRLEDAGVDLGSLRQNRMRLAFGIDE